MAAFCIVPRQRTISCLSASIRIIHRRKSCANLSPLANAFNAFTVATGNKPPQNSTGLFQNKLLDSPSGFKKLVSIANEQCEQLLSEALSVDRKRSMVQILDDMSDAVCRVADMADGIRMLHPDGSYRSAASEACQAIGLLVEQLNTTLGLYDASVREAECDGSVSGREKMDRIDRRVLNLFIADFEMSGVQLQDPIRRANFVSAAETALAIGADFVNMSHTPVSVRLSDSPSGLEDNPVQLTSPLSSEPHPNIRMLAYKAYYSPILGQEQRLTDLIEARHRMAYAAGFANFAERSTQHSIAQTPELVYQFLHTVCRRLRPYAAYSAREHLIPAVREADSRFVDCKPKIPSAGPRLWPWDVGYSLSLNRHIALTNELIDYFSLGACMEGVSQLATCLFGLQLRVEPTQPGETWHPQVLKVGVYRTEGGCGQHGSESIGTVYCDLLDRPGKPVQDCHYTIQGGRRLNDGVYQNPIIALQLTLSPSSVPSCPPLLSFGQVENLFHEWGHALHSMLARTRYQHVTGTRCSTDLAEIPSTLFERFALDPRVVKEYARHWRTGKSLRRDELSSYQQLSIITGLGSSVELLQQATYSLFDQILHSGPPSSTLMPYKGTEDLPASSRLLSQIQQDVGLNEWMVCDAVHLGAWPHRFSHLVGYGGRYYSYLMARAGASLVWKHCFADDPWSSSKGQHYADRVLRHGGEFPPAQLLSDLLCDDDSPGADLSPERLANDLADQVEEFESTATSVLTKLRSPGLHQPKGCL